MTTVLYGQGASYQALCPAFPPAPAGYVAWDTSVNGAIPANVLEHAQALANDATKPLGYTDTVYSGGVPLLVRVDAHTWTTDAQGNVVAGCFHGADVFVPVVQAPASASSTPTMGGLFLLSVGLGIVVSGISIYEWVKKP